MVVNRTSMVAIADELERRGYVERRRDADDRRSYALHLTNAGRGALERLHTEIAVADRAMTGALRDDERARMNELLLAFVGSEAGHAIPPQLTDRSGFLVARAHVLARDEANELLRPLGITVRHFGLLTLLDRRGPSSQQAIAGAMLISATMVTQLVDQVEAAGLAERRPNPSDRRSYRVTLTAAGRRTLRAAGAVMDGLDARFAAALGAGGDRELQDLLRKLVGA